MNRPPVGIALQDKNRRPSCVIRIVFDKGSSSDTDQDIINKYIIVGELLVAVVGNADLPVRDECLNACQRLAHCPTPPA